MSGFTTLNLNDELLGYKAQLEMEINEQFLDYIFPLTKEVFETRVKNHYDKMKLSYSEKPNIIQFLIAVPYDLRIQERFLFHFPLKGGLCSYNLKKITSVEAYFPIKWENYSPLFKREFSIIEMTYTTPDDITLENYHKYIEILFNTLNTFVEAYKIQTGETGVNYINNQSSHFLSFYRAIDPSIWKTKFGGPFYLNCNIPKPKGEMDMNEFDKIWTIAYNLLEKLQPFNLSEELLTSAHNYASNGLLRESILFSQMSIESFIRTLYHQILLLEGKQEEEITNVLQDEPFMGIVKKELSKRIGGVWDVTSTGTYVYYWHEKTYKIRHRIIHAGYKPNLKEAKEAFDAVEKLKFYIYSLLFNKGKKYQDITKYLNKDYMKNFES